MATFNKFSRFTIKYNYRQTEVSQTRATRVVNKDTRPFQVSVDHAVRMQIAETVGHAEHESEPVGVRMCVNIMGKLSARHIYREGLKRIRTCTDEGYDILVVQTSPQRDFLTERPFSDFFLVGGVGSEPPYANL